MIVVDTNVLCYLALPGTHTAAAERLYAKDPDWCAPVLWRSELRNVLAGYVRRKQLEVTSAIDIVDAVEELLRGRDFQVPTAEVMRLAEGSRCSAYDCEFVALAEELGVPLFTSDRQVLKDFPVVARELV